jgi:hypothetical protein
MLGLRQSTTACHPEAIRSIGEGSRLEAFSFFEFLASSAVKAFTLFDSLLCFSAPALAWPHVAPGGFAGGLQVFQQTIKRFVIFY